MAAEDSDLEKTEQPSERKLEQAREKGQVAHSRELSTFMVTLLGAVVLWIMGTHLTEQLVQLLKNGLSWEKEVAFDVALILPHLFKLSWQALLMLLPLLGVTLLAALFTPMLISGWNFSTEALAPKLSKLNPIAGIGRMFSMNSLVELIKSLLKTVLIGGVAIWAIWYFRDEMLQLVALPIQSGIYELGHFVGLCTLAAVASMLLIVAIDVPWQLWEHYKQLRMTKEEVRQESKETEGDPMVKGRIRAMQREAARRRMMASIPTADVVVTNPTHYSVALKYSENGTGAPIVVAKGSHLLALKIREIAAEHQVPLLEAPPLARALYKHTDLGQQIPEALYTAVAQVLAYVYQLKHQQRFGGDTPQYPADLPVPEGMDPGPDLEPEAEQGDRA